MKLIRCPYCSSNDTVMRGRNKNQSGPKQRYKCKSCNKSFVESDGYERMRHNPDVIELAVKMKNEGYSLSQVREHLNKHYEIKVTRETIRRWCKKYKH